MTGSHRRIEAVIFDLDDTLINWANPAVSWLEFIRPRSDRVHAYLAAAGHQVPTADDFFGRFEDIVRQTWDEARKTWQIRSMGEVLAQLFTNMGLDNGRIDIDEVLRVYDWGPLPGVIPFADTVPVLKELRRREYKIGLLTNSLLPMWMRDAELRAYRLIDYLDARISSGDCGYLKPHPAIFHEILNRLQTIPERAVFIGDRPQNDIAGANEVGLISVLMSPPHLDRELDGVQPNFTIAALSELLPILERLETEATPWRSRSGS